MIIENQKNIKVHYAGSEVMNRFYAIEEMNRKYILYTAFPFLERKILKTKKSPIIAGHLKGNLFEIPKYISKNKRHVIQDSGLFTLMFGSHQGKKDNQFIDNWYNGLIEFTLENDNGATIVEVDCQKVLGEKKAWHYREKMKNDLPNRQMNVFHIEDGQKGLDRLIEFSDYLAISVPELRFLGKKKSVIPIANYIKTKKPEIDIHLLGCTELDILKELSFCTSADSTTYVSGMKFGYVKKYHISRLKKEKVMELTTKDVYDKIRKWNNEQNTLYLIFQLYNLNKQYEKFAGSQD